MAEQASSSQARAVRLWLLAVAALVFVMVVVGGATRLTESGLSIVEWKPVTGALPPLSDTAWQAAFDQYKTIPQYTQMNAGMTLAEFKTIFWWEWSHRLLGRLVGAAYLVPFLFFLWRGAVGTGLRGRLWGIFALGAVQGAVGWWMVASGLTERVNVSQYRLAFHLTLAAVIYAALVWTAERLRQASPAPSASLRAKRSNPGAAHEGGEKQDWIASSASPPRNDESRRLWFTARLLVALTLLQVYLGALVAGLRAGYAFNTWPLIDGALVPAADRLWFETPWWRNLFENALTVQFDHRLLAYVLTIVVVWHAIDARRARPMSAVVHRAAWLVLAVIAQAALGIATLLYQVPIALALAHQAMAMVVLTLATLHAARLPAPARAGVPYGATPISRR